MSGFDIPMPQQSKQQFRNALEVKLYGNFLSAFCNELFGNSGHFLVLKTLTDLVSLKPHQFLADPTNFLLIFTMLVQASYLARPSANRFWGNLIGASLYTLIDLTIDGVSFFESPAHLILWVFAGAIAILQGIRDQSPRMTQWMLPFESVVRTMMVAAFYSSIQLQPSHLLDYLQRLQNFSSVPRHQFLFGSTLLLGLLLGFQELQLKTQRQELQKVAELLRNLAEWGMGSHAVATAVTNPQALEFHECDRTILFMDIREFTAWCEQTQPELVITVLNDYYHYLEPCAAAYHPLRVTFTADEIMAIYNTPTQGVAAAQLMAQTAQRILEPYGISAGCAVHCGKVIEGLFGSQAVRTYTVIGDTVNTAKRLENATPSREITLSDAVYQALSVKPLVKARPPIIAKGKAEPLVAWQLIQP